MQTAYKPIGTMKYSAGLGARKIDETQHFIG